MIGSGDARSAERASLMRRLFPARSRRAADRQQRDDEHDHGPPRDCERAVVPGEDVPQADSLRRYAGRAHRTDGLAPSLATAGQGQFVVAPTLAVAWRPFPSETVWLVTDPPSWR